jgi:hypothetical protein
MTNTKITIADIRNTTGQSGLSITTDGLGGFELTLISGGASSYLDNLLDVTVLTPAGGDVLYYDSGQWINQPSDIFAASGHLHDSRYTLIGHTHTESDITDLEHDAIKIQGRDVATTAPSDGQSIAWNDSLTQWEPTTISGGSGSITIQEDDSGTASNVTTLNFEGGVTTLDEGGGKVTITVSGGTLASGISVLKNGGSDITDITTLNFIGSSVSIADGGSGQADITISGGTGGPGVADFTVWFPDAPPASGYSYLGTDDDEFDDSSFDTGIWSEFDVAGTQTVGEDEFGVYMTTTSINHIQGIYQPVPSGITNWSFTTYVGPHWDRDNQHRSGILLIEDTGNLSTSDVWLWAHYRGGAGYGWQGIYHTDYDSWSVDDHNAANDNKPSAMYLRFRRDGTNWYFDYSEDGKSWVSNQYERVKRWNVTGIGLGHKFDNTNMTARFPFARFRNDSAKDQLLYGDRINMWRSS